MEGQIPMDYTRLLLLVAVVFFAGTLLLNLISSDDTTFVMNTAPFGGSVPGVWVMEPGTGKVKYCILSSAKEYDPPKCTPWSEDVPLCKEDPEDPFRCAPDAR